jgi:hypothetical protein
MWEDAEALGVNSSYTISQDTSTARREPLPDAATLTENPRQRPTAAYTANYTSRLLSRGRELATPDKTAILFHLRYARKVGA